MGLELIDFWLPVLVAAVGVFVVSSLFHMVSRHHKSDWSPVPDEDGLMSQLTSQGVKAPGTYMFPHHDGDGMPDEAFMKRYEAGPAGMLILCKPGPMNMGKTLMQWFAYCVTTGAFTAYICVAAQVKGTDFMTAFQVAGAVAFGCYAWAEMAACIWKSVPSHVTAKFLMDGLAYGLVTGAVFGWLWPAAM